jgi:hypothetical protein
MCNDVNVYKGTWCQKWEVRLEGDSFRMSQTGPSESNVSVADDIPHFCRVRNVHRNTRPISARRSLKYRRARGPLSLVSTTEELLARQVAAHV